MQYRVQWNYASSRGGPWKAGDVVEIDHAGDAEAINQDSPGVLVPATIAPSAASAAPAARDVDEAPNDRMMAEPAARRGPGRPPKGRA